MSPSADQDEQAFVVRVVDDPALIDARAWDTLLATQTASNPFMQHAYLAALHQSGSAVPSTGWQPQFVLIESTQGLQAACALYLKAHSYGEYVFDWAWADAYQRHGLRYYPKLLGAVPFTPVPGARLLASNAAWRARLVQALVALATQRKLSSVHLLFLNEADQKALARAGWMMRNGVQFHWQQDPVNPASNFRDFLARLQRDKRKKIQQEQRRVVEAGVSFEVCVGAAITPAHWDFFYDCYVLTYAAHHSTPYLSRRFFGAMARDMPDNWVMFVAQRNGQPVAASLVAVDAASGTAWGRYWGCVEPIACLHFDACYYQPLAWCLAQGYQRFEGGAQGEHKMARGLLPVVTHSAHWLADERFANAVADFLTAEGQGIEQYVDELRERNPFKTASSD